MQLLPSRQTRELGPVDVLAYTDSREATLLSRLLHLGASVNSTKMQH